MTKFRHPQFPEAGLRFLKSLKRNNNREWFQEHKHVYEDSVRLPMTEFVEALAEEFRNFAPEVVASPKASLFRIHRDTRFSKDKTPYKTHVAAVFPARGLNRHEGAAFYFHIDPGEVLVGGGLYRPASEELRAVRGHIAAEHARLKSILHARPFRRMFGELSGEQLSRLPRGFSADHPAAAYLRFKDFLASRLLSPPEVTTPRFFATVVETFRAANSLIRFLNEPILQARRVRERQDSFLKPE